MTRRRLHAAFSALVLALFAQSAAAQSAQVPEWFLHPPAQEGYLTEVASSDSNLNALVEALVRLATSRRAHSARGIEAQPSPADGVDGNKGAANDSAATRKYIVSESFGPVKIQTTRTIGPGDKARKLETSTARIELKTARGEIKIKAYTEITATEGRSEGKTEGVETVFTAEIRNASVRDLVEALRRGGVTVVTDFAAERFFVLLKYKIPTPPASPSPAAGK
jgi:hypothetical protein